MKRIQEQSKQQHIPLKVYRTGERLMITAPMAGLEPENIVVEVTAEGHLVLHGDRRGMLKEVKELLLDDQPGTAALGTQCLSHDTNFCI